jgi:hypothetical protein
MLEQERFYEVTSIQQEDETAKTNRLKRLADKYRVIVPEIPYGLRDDQEDEHWERGWASRTWFLKPAATASIYLQIDEAKKRRREAWESRTKIVSNIAPWLITLISVLFSFYLASRR